jgi:large subunit ribosomal protein L6e
VIATSTHVDVSNVDVSDINDEYFARDKVSSSESEEQFFKGDAPKPAIVTDKRKVDQKRIDAALLKSVEAVPMLRGYLNAKFSLTKSDRPHLMVF